MITAQKCRDSFAKSIYGFIMNYVTCTINGINGTVEKASSYIGILDIAGFGKQRA